MMARMATPPRALSVHLALLCSLLLSACASTAPDDRLAALYEKREAEAARGRQPSVSTVNRRAREALDLATGSPDLGTGDLLRAALLAYDSRVLEHVSLARELALTAVERGDARGLPIAAEAEDIELMLRGLPQRYGTQYVYDPVTERWSLYPVRDATTDTERAAMGLSTIAEARQREDVLNARKPELPASFVDGLSR